jgi:hypothetical protein
MNVEIGAEAMLFPEKEYISGIFVAVWVIFLQLARRAALPALCSILYNFSLERTVAGSYVEVSNS